jgi:hypothetical protein
LITIKSDEAQRIAADVAKLPELRARKQHLHLPVLGAAARAVRHPFGVPEQQRLTGEHRKALEQPISAVVIEIDHADLVALAKQGELPAIMIDLIAAPSKAHPGAHFRR